MAEPSGARADAAGGPATTPALLRGLVDDAGLFPPTALAMPDAVRRHRRDRAAGHAMLTHRFLCPASRWDELRSALGPRETMDVGVVLDAAAPEGPADGRPRVTHYELRAAPEEAVAAAERALPAGTAPGYVEVERGPGWLEGVVRLASTGSGRLRAKVRCGGVRAELFPGVEELAEFVTTCAEHGIPFKATAGLHHAVRHTDPETGFTHHGYLNLLLAAAAAADGRGRAAVRDALEVADAERLAAGIRSLPEATATRTRALFVSYGSCSTGDPIADVGRLGLAPGAHPTTRRRGET